MHPTSPLSHHVENGAITTVDGIRFLLACDPTRAVVVGRPDGSVARLTLGEFIEERRLAAQCLRQAEIQSCLAACIRRLQIVRSTVKWRLRLAARTLALLRSAP